MDNKIAKKKTNKLKWYDGNNDVAKKVLEVKIGGKWKAKSDNDKR